MTFLLVAKHHILVICDKGIRCLEKSMQTIVQACASKLINQPSDLTVDEDLMEEAPAHLESVRSR